MNPTYESLLPRIEQFKAAILSRWPGAEIEAEEGFCCECGQSTGGAHVEIYNLPDSPWLERLDKMFDIEERVFGDDSPFVEAMPFMKSKEEVHGPY